MLSYAQIPILIPLTSCAWLWLSRLAALVFQGWIQKIIWYAAAAAPSRISSSATSKVVFKYARIWWRSFFSFPDEIQFTTQGCFKIEIWCAKGLSKWKQEFELPQEAGEKTAAGSKVMSPYRHSLKETDQNRIQPWPSPRQTWFSAQAWAKENLLLFQSISLQVMIAS